MTSRRGYHRHRHHVSRPTNDQEVTRTVQDAETPQPDWDMLPNAPFNGTGKLLTRNPRRRRREEKLCSHSGKDVNPFDVEELGSMVAYEIHPSTCKDKNVYDFEEKNV